MLGHTKKRPTDKVILRFEGPKRKKREAVSALKALGFDTIENSTSVPWRDAFPEFVANEPGTCLAGARNKKGFTQVALSELTGIPRRHISEMENGKRPIGKMTANKLAEVLDVDYRVFL
jgi:DNA-binding XRE family transcriptional regulator